MNNKESKVCKDCKVDRKINEFLGKETCYKCQYTAKLAMIGKRKKIRYCHQCHTRLANNRWAYCSDECAAEGKRQNLHWTLACRGDTKNWKKRFIF